MTSTTGVPAFKLNTGATIPSIGLGVWAGLEQDKIRGSKDWVLSALKAGYRHIDTAIIYQTEKPVGQAIKESGIPREELFITTKFAWHHGAYIQRSFKESLSNLDVDYVDLYLMHWPQLVHYDSGYNLPTDGDAAVKNLKTVENPTISERWAELESIYASGKAKAIGVSNFSVKTLEVLLKTAKIIPAVNQVELHPYLPQTELLDYCKSKGIMLTAYTPTGYARVREDPLIVELATKYRCTPAQIILAWHVARGTPAVPKSENPERQVENITLPTLSSDDVAHLTSLDKNERIGNPVQADGKVFGWTFEQLGWE